MARRGYVSRDAFATEIAASKQVPDCILRKQFVCEDIAKIGLSGDPLNKTDVSRQRKFTVSTAAVDRDNDSISVAGWKLDNYRKNPTVLFAHDYASLPIARAVSIGIENGKLVATAEFAEHDMAETCLKLIDGGFLRATSVGFRPIAASRAVERDGFDFKEQELLEFSIVPVPANPEALIHAQAGGIDIAPLKAWAEGVMKGLKAADTCKNCGADLGKMGALKENGDCAKCGKPTKQASATTTAAAEEFLTLDDETKSDTSTCTACGGPMTDGKCAACGWHSPESPELVSGMEVHASLDGTADDPIRWNRRLSKSFDVDGEPLNASKLEYTWVSRFLNTPVKDLYETTLNIPSPRMGSYLSALDEKLAPFKTETIRRLTYGGAEEPPVYETIQLNSKLSKTFLVDGIRFLTGPNKMVAKIEPSWAGVSLTVYGAALSSEKILDFLNEIGARAAQYKFMKGEAFALSGEFLDRGAETWSDLFLAPVDIEPIKRTVALVNEQGAAMESRGQIFAGKPGTGKTLAGRVMMNEAKDATFIWVSTRDFYRSGAIGGLGLAYDLAAENAPSIIFVEDIDSWLDNSAIDMLKTELDGLKQRKGIVTVLTTNFPEQLPEALIDRPGRFHDVLIMSLPTETIRRAMLAKWAPDAKPATLDTLAADTRAFSGAHLRELVRFADTIRAQDGAVIDAALTQAMEKVTAQRTLIDETRRGPKLRTIESITLRKNIATSKGYTPGEEAAELVQYQTLGTMLDQVGSILTSARGLVSGLISDETDAPTSGSSAEAAEEAVESARLESVIAFCEQMIGGLEGVRRLAGTTNDTGLIPGMLMSASLAKRSNGHGTCAKCGCDGEMAVHVCGECVNKLHPWDGEAMAARVAALAKDVLKRGRVISAKNEEKLKTASDLIDQVLSQIAEAPLSEAAAVPSLELKRGDDYLDVDADIVILDDDIDVIEIDMNDALDVTPQEFRAALRDALTAAVSGIVQVETQATLNRLRGRVE